jgi:predicted secreted hydrolase
LVLLKNQNNPILQNNLLRNNPYLVPLKPHKTMKKFHISFYEQEDDFFSKGENFESDGPVWAIQQWELKYPNAIFISCVSAEAIRHNYGIQQAVQHSG